MCITNATRREVMLLAWGSRRANPLVAFAEHLRRAWRYVKNIGRKPLQVMRLAPSLIQSPIERRLGRGSWADWTAARVTAAVGR